jgi:hypothetical protein
MRASGSRLLLACFLVACSSVPGGLTAADRADWKQWAETFVGAACNHDQACGVEVGAACYETGVAAADQASCDAAVAFYLAHRDELEACTLHYPPTCPLTPGQACPVIKDHPFESLCP